jgi:methylated-DNA-[protein]-cysteine S-methyltransferase
METPTIFTTYIQTPLGALEISATSDFLTSILFVDTQKRPSPQNQATQELSPVMIACIDQLNEYFDGTRKVFDLVFVHEGTDFQKKVWAELLNIPYGKTISYLDLSKRIGNEKAIRAVGTTNGNNQFTIVVPCHRVIGSNGSLVGYGGDLWRKKWLLDHEAKISGNYQMSLF